MESTLSATECKVKEIELGLLDIKGLLERLRQLVDIRGQRGRRYQLAPLLLLIVLAKLSGEDKPSAIADWVSGRAEWLAQALDLKWAKMPHHNTYRRVLAFVVEPEALDQVVSEHLKSLPGVGASRLIGMDGKAVRGTISAKNPQGQHLLVAYLPEEGIVLGQADVDGKENEIVVAPELLGRLDLRGKIVMGDAMHAQRGLSKQIVDAGGEYIWLIKKNQRTVLEEIEYLFAPDAPTVLGTMLPHDFVSHQESDKGHGRIEKRRITVSAELKGYTKWPALEQVFQVERWRTEVKTGKSETAVVYGVTSLTSKESPAADLAYLIRAYWGVENGLHGRRDVTFNEDRTRQTLGRAGHVMASLNNLVIGLLRHAGFANIASARRACDAILHQTKAQAIARLLT